MSVFSVVYNDFIIIIIYYYIILYIIINDFCYCKFLQSLIVVNFIYVC
jgi:hypothetical protein